MLVEGVRGPEKVRHCSVCQEYVLQLVGVFHQHGTPQYPEPFEFSHLDPCPVCADMIEKGELVPDDTARGCLDGVRGAALGSAPRVAEDALRPS